MEVAVLIHKAMQGDMLPPHVNKYADTYAVTIEANET